MEIRDYKQNLIILLFFYSLFFFIFNGLIPSFFVNSHSNLSQLKIILNKFTNWHFLQYLIKNQIGLFKISWYFCSILFIFFSIYFLFKLFAFNEKTTLLFFSSLFFLFNPVIKNISNYKPYLFILSFLIIASFLYFQKKFLLSSLLFAFTSIFFPQIIFLYFIFILNDDFICAYLFLFFVLIFNASFLIFVNWVPLIVFIKNFITIPITYRYMPSENQSILSFLLRTNIFLLHWSINLYYLFLICNFLKLFFFFICIYSIEKYQNKHILLKISFLLLTLLFFENHLDDNLFVLMLFPYIIILKFLNDFYEKNILLIILFFISYLLLAFDINLNNNVLKYSILSFFISLKLFSLFLLWLINLFFICKSN